MSGILLPEKFKQFGNLPLIRVLRMFDLFDSDKESQLRVPGRHETRAHEKSRRRICKASQRRNRHA